MANLVPKSGQAQEKSNFIQSCNLWSQCFKERGNFKGPETSRSPTKPIKLLPMESSADQTLRHKAVASTKVTTADFFPQFVGLGSPNPIKNTTNKPDFRKSSTTVPGTAQMTIFYAGKVMVFDDFPADKAKEVVALASKGSTYNISTGIINSADSVAPVSNNAQEQLQLQPQANGSEARVAASLLGLHLIGSLPRGKRGLQQETISNKQPLHRILTRVIKRKENQWLELEGQYSSKQLELKLQS